MREKGEVAARRRGLARGPRRLMLISSHAEAGLRWWRLPWRRLSLPSRPKSPMANTRRSGRSGRPTTVPANRLTSRQGVPQAYQDDDLQEGVVQGHAQEAVNAC